MVVNVRVITPAAISAEVGVYVAFRVVLFGTKLPAPPLQMPPLAMPTEPFSTTLALLAQAVMSAPAFTTGGGVKFRETWSATDTQPPLPVVVRVSVTLPAAISAGVGE